MKSGEQLAAKIDGVVTSDKTMFRVGTQLGLPMLTIEQALKQCQSRAPCPN